jgi:hypothetical protein
MKKSFNFFKIKPSRVKIPQKVPTGRSVFLSGFLLSGGLFIKEVLK